MPAARKPWLRILTNPVFLLSAGAFVGIAGTLMWPRELPLIARHTPSMLGNVMVLERSAAPTSLPATHVEVKAAARPLLPAVDFDRETQMLSRARMLIGQGQYTEALAVLRQHEREFPRSEQVAVRNRYIAISQAGKDRANAAIPKSH